MTQSWFDPGQNRESGGRTSERTDYSNAPPCLATTPMQAEGGPPDPT